MTPITRKAAVLLGTAAMFGAAGCGATKTGSSDQASATSSAPTAQQAQQASPAQQAGTPPGLSSLASALGVSTAKLQAAMETTRPQGSAGDTPGAPPSSATMAQDLAKALDLDEDDVAAALTASMPQGGPQQGAAPQSQSDSGSTQSSTAQPGGVQSGQS